MACVFILHYKISIVYIVYKKYISIYKISLVHYFKYIYCGLIHKQLEKPNKQYIFFNVTVYFGNHEHKNAKTDD